jgi:hypothetical protein
MNKNEKSQKKGSVINRKYNRTIDQDKQRSEPKWVDMGGGVLKRAKGFPNYAKVGAGGRLVPMTRHAVRFFLSAREEAAKAIAKVVDQAAE